MPLFTSFLPVCFMIYIKQKVHTCYCTHFYLVLQAKYRSKCGIILDILPNQLFDPNFQLLVG